MYIPQRFQMTNENVIWNFVASHAFGTLVTSQGGLTGSHVPMLMEEGPDGRRKLLGHIARANLQWQQADGSPALAIFLGPHAYISPRWYEAKNVVPTWNYLSVHIAGTIQFFDDRDRLLDLVQRSVDFFEDDAGASRWSIEENDRDVIQSLCEAIVGFEMSVDSVQGQWKLNQHHSEERRRK
ncbi:MAG: FMN-binding negative transcriptional regulator, partial [Planctomycetaceae bacterium]|nr:FMN-binding negative transcriptional regulator [Planctomycetaceae bacterium]